MKLIYTTSQVLTKIVEIKVSVKRQLMRCKLSLVEIILTVCDSVANGIAHPTEVENFRLCSIMFYLLE